VNILGYYGYIQFGLGVYFEPVGTRTNLTKPIFVINLIFIISFFYQAHPFLLIHNYCTCLPHSLSLLHYRHIFAPCFLYFVFCFLAGMRRNSWAYNNGFFICLFVGMRRNKKLVKQPNSILSFLLMFHLCVFLLEC